MTEPSAEERAIDAALASSPGAARTFDSLHLGEPDLAARADFLATAREVVEALDKLGRCDTEIDVTRPYGDRYADRHSPTCRKCALLVRPEG